MAQRGRGADSTIDECLASLRASRRRIVGLLQAITDAQLGIPIRWGGRDADVRFLLHRLADVDALVSGVLQVRLDARGWRQPEAAQILGGRLASILDLLVGFPDELLDRRPALGEWSVGEVLDHLQLVERRTCWEAAYAVRLARPELPIQVPTGRLLPMGQHPVAAPSTREALDRLEAAATATNTLLSTLPDSLLSVPSPLSNGAPDVRSLCSHLRAHAQEHSVQVAKTLEAIGWRRAEAQIILGQAERARAAIEAAVLGYPDELVWEPYRSLESVGSLLTNAHYEASSLCRAVLESGLGSRVGAVAGLTAADVERLRRTAIVGRVAFALTCIERALRHLQVADPDVDQFVELWWGLVGSSLYTEEPLPIHELLDAVEYQGSKPVPDRYAHIPFAIAEMLYNAEEIAASQWYGAVMGYSEDSLRCALKVALLCVANGVDLPPLEPFVRVSFGEEGAWGKPRSRESFRQ